MKAQVTKEYITIRMRVDEWTRLNGGVLDPEKARMRNLDPNTYNLINKLQGAVAKPVNANWVEPKT